MSDKVKGGLLMSLAVLLYAVSAVTGFAALYALTVRTTLAAVESAFGTFVIMILLLVFARRCWDNGKQLRQTGTEAR